MDRKESRLLEKLQQGASRKEGVVEQDLPRKTQGKEGCIKAGRKPILTFSEQVKLRSIQAAFGKDSPEEVQFWEQACVAAKLRRAIKRGKCIKTKPRKYKCYKDAHNAANRAYYQRHKDKVSEKNRRWYERNKERKKAYYTEHKERIRTYYKEWYDEQKDK